MAFGRDDLTRFANRWWGLIWTLAGTLVSIAVICAVNMVLDAVATWEAIVFGVLTGGSGGAWTDDQRAFLGRRASLKLYQSVSGH